MRDPDHRRTLAQSMREQVEAATDVPRRPVRCGAWRLLARLLQMPGQEVRMPKSVKSRAKTAAPAKVVRSWWLIAEEECPHCEQGYAYEMEVRCAECDEAICPLCAARENHRMVCPQCVPAGGK